MRKFLINLIPEIDPDTVEMSPSARKIYKMMEKNKRYQTKDIVQMTGIPKPTVTSKLNELAHRSLLRETPPMFCNKAKRIVKGFTKI